MDLGGLSWAMITIVGVAILAIVLAYAALRNRSERPTADTEAATRRVYEEEDEAHRGESDNVV